MKKLLSFLLFLTTTCIIAQTKVSGTVVDAETGTPLPGANIIVSGTNIGATTDFDGKFILEVEQLSGELTISYVGFQDTTIPYSVSEGKTKNIGVIQLSADDNALGEVVLVGKGVIDLEKDRKTPIAVSTVTKKEIQQKAVGNVEFPEVLKNTPSVYVSNQAGGFGDSQMFVRGFDQTNTAFLLNGQPINGMEDGKVYWSNWAGMADIANVVQVQRGLGSSKLAISSVGGTVNIVTKATERTKGGFARFLVGNGSYVKGTAAYNTGINENGWGFSFLVDYWQAHSKYANGTKGQGQNYFFSVGKKAGDHTFNFLITGAPQWHDQNFSKNLELYDRYGVKYNNNYGFKDGEYLSLRRNYYHKPILNLNWDWDINETSSLSTVVYASFGRGGGTGDYGNGVGYIDYPNAPAEPIQSGAYKPSNGLIDWDYIKNTYNAGIENGLSDGYNGTLLRSSVNNHRWYGSVINYENNSVKYISFNVGADLRFYQGDHFRQLVDLLGLNGRIEPNAQRPDNYVVSKTFNPDPWASLFDFADKKDRVAYDYSEWLNYQGGFGQVEFAKDGFSAFAQGALSNQSYQREDRWNFPIDKKSGKINKTGYNLKAGAGWTFIEGNTIFVNSGKYSRQPFLDNVFSGGGNEIELADPQVDNEEITGFEAGYKFEKGSFKVNLNAYYTTWENRFLYTTGSYKEYDEAGFLFTDISQRHKGLELDVHYKPMTNLTLRGYGTVGNWEYDGTTPVKIRDNDSFTFVDNIEASLTGTKVGMAPQTTAGLGAIYNIVPNKLSVDADWNYYTDLYGEVDVEELGLASVNNEKYESEKLNSYSLFDLGVTYNFTFGDNAIEVRGNAYNLFDNEYINQKDNYGYYYGNGFTWNLSVKYKF